MTLHSCRVRGGEKQTICYFDRNRCVAVTKTNIDSVEIRSSESNIKIVYTTIYLYKFQQILF